MLMESSTSSSSADSTELTASSKQVPSNFPSHQGAAPHVVSAEPVASPELTYLWYKLTFLSMLAVILAIVGLSVNWYFIRIVSAPMSLGNVTMGVMPTPGPSSQVVYDFSLTQISTTSLNSRTVRSFDQYVLPDVQATFTGARAAVIIGLVGGLISGLNYLLMSQGWLLSSVSFFVAKLWYRFQTPLILTVVSFIGAVASMLSLMALPPAFMNDDILIQLNNPQGGTAIPLQSTLSCAVSKSIIDCSLLFESNVQTQIAAQFNAVHRPVAGWWVMLVSSFLTLYVLSQAWSFRNSINAHVAEVINFHDEHEKEDPLNNLI